MRINDPELLLHLWLGGIATRDDDTFIATDELGAIMMSIPRLQYIGLFDIGMDDLASDGWKFVGEQRKNASE